MFFGIYVLGLISCWLWLFCAIKFFFVLLSWKKTNLYGKCAIVYLHTWHKHNCCLFFYWIGSVLFKFFFNICQKKFFVGDTAVNGTESMFTRGKPSLNNLWYCFTFPQVCGNVFKETCSYFPDLSQVPVPSWFLPFLSYLLPYMIRIFSSVP